MAHLAEPPPPVDAVNPAVGGTVAEVVAQALAKAPADRCSRIADFGEALARAT